MSVKKNKRINFEQREKIEFFLKNGFSREEIIEKLHISMRALTRELKRVLPYSALVAENMIKKINQGRAQKISDTLKIRTQLVKNSDIHGRLVSIENHLQILCQKIENLINESNTNKKKSRRSSS